MEFKVSGKKKNRIGKNSFLAESPFREGIPDHLFDFSYMLSILRRDENVFSNVKALRPPSTIQD